MKWILGIIVAVLALFAMTGCAMNVKPGKVQLCMGAEFAPEDKGKDGKIEITLADNVIKLAETALGVFRPMYPPQPASPSPGG